MVEPTHLKNVSQIGSSPQIGMKIKYTPPKINMEPLKRNIIFQAFIFGFEMLIFQGVFETTQPVSLPYHPHLPRVLPPAPPIGHDSPTPSPIGHGEIHNNVASSKRMGPLMGTLPQTNMAHGT